MLLGGYELHHPECHYLIAQLALITRGRRHKCPAAPNVFLFYFLLLTITLRAMSNSNCTSEASWIWKTKHFCFPSSKKNEKPPKHSLWPACATAWSAEPWSVLHPSTVPGAAAHPGARQREQPCLWPLQQQKPSAAGRAADNLLNAGLYIHSSWAQWVSAAACPVWKRPLMTAVVTDAYRCRHDFL